MKTYQTTADETSAILFEMQHPAMATIFSLYLYARSSDEAASLADPAFQEIDRIEALLSNYQSSSELSRINRDAAAAPVNTDEETFSFIARSLYWSAVSQGAFDITVGKLMRKWGFFGGKGRLPSSANLAAMRSEIGWQQVKLNAADQSVQFLVPGIELDPGGIGKGYAVERAVAILRSNNIASALLSAGSSTIYALGTPAGKEGWKVQVPGFGSDAETLSTVVLRDTSLSTANCSEKYFVEDGHLYSHIMDPRTLRPAEGTLQATVIAPSATDSDALSNVLFVSGAERGARLLREFPAVSALMMSGTPQAITCNAVRWNAAVRTESCTTLVNEGEQTNESQRVIAELIDERDGWWAAG